jgi:hypothetical protein
LFQSYKKCQVVVIEQQGTSSQRSPLQFPGKELPPKNKNNHNQVTDDHNIFIYDAREKKMIKILPLYSFVVENEIHERKKLLRRHARSNFLFYSNLK